MPTPDTIMAQAMSSEAEPGGLNAAADEPGGFGAPRNDEPESAVRGRFGSRRIDAASPHAQSILVKAAGAADTARAGVAATAKPDMAMDAARYRHDLIMTFTHLPGSSRQGMAWPPGHC